jgi:predicted secreted protein
MVELTEHDDGSAITMAVGSVFTVRLNEAATAAFRWSVDDDGGGAVALTSEQLRPGAGVGGQAEHEFRFVAVTQGSARLTLVHRRAWSPDDPGAGRWQVDIEIVGSVTGGGDR